MTTPTTPPPPDAALDALAAAAAEHLAALDAPRAADDLSGLRHVGERLAASNALAAASVATARGLVAAVDALRAAEARRDALAAAVRAERERIVALIRAHADQCNASAEDADGEGDIEECDAWCTARDEAVKLADAIAAPTGGAQ